MDYVTKEGVRVEVGQKWRDLDKRMNGRTVVVTRVANGFAYYEKPVKNRVSVQRLRRPFWELATDPTEPPGGGE